MNDFWPSHQIQSTFSQFLVEKVPPTLYYITNFITKAEEDELIRNTYAAPKPKWTYLSNRRLQNWGGLPHPKGMVVEPLPEWLQKYAKKMADLGVFENHIPNHVLVNEYLPGQGIMPHEDGSLFYPTITTINLGSHTVLNYYHKRNDEHGETADCSENKDDIDNRPLSSVLLERCSLLIVQNDMYHKYLHGIEEKEEDEITDAIANLDKCSVIPPTSIKRETRISLTIRYVPKTFKTTLHTLYKNFR